MATSHCNKKIEAKAVVASRMDGVGDTIDVASKEPVATVQRKSVGDILAKLRKPTTRTQTITTAYKHRVDATTSDAACQFVSSQSFTTSSFVCCPAPYRETPPPTAKECGQTGSWCRAARTSVRTTRVDCAPPAPPSTAAPRPSVVRTTLVHNAP